MNDGGAAFPGHEDIYISGAWVTTDVGGMSLRDYMAIHSGEEEVFHHRIIQEGDADYNPQGTSGEARSLEAAKYHYADAMLAEREKANERSVEP